ncbi:MAG TPA: 3-oxoadipate enol-lactonase [Ramlibacter sp.]|jgi:3-oxoadipate enol-lactonase|nr:3-oxoadipate enol-lactonase [Ramlibacter sp.]
MDTLAIVSPGSGQDVAYRREGRQGAPAVLLVHGLLSDHRMWDPVVERLMGDYEVLRYDLRGHGHSSAPPPPYTLEQLADDVPALLDALGIARVHFIGTSLGGMIGQQVAARHPHRLLSATLANTGAVQGAAAAWDERIALAREQGMAPLAEPTLQRWFGAAFRASAPSEVERMRRTLLQVTRDGYVGCATAVRNLSQLELLPRITVPTLVIAGQNDEAIPHAAGEKIAQTIPGAQLVSLPTGHQAAVEQPEAFVAAWRTFVARVRP